MKSENFKVFADENKVAQAIASLAIEKILLGLRDKPFFHLSLTGGSAGNLVSKFLCDIFNQEPLRFSGLHIWWGDERFVSIESPERNDAVIRENLQPNSPIHLHTVLSPEAVADVETAAKRYNLDLSGMQMDLGIFGVGADGHLASLFPKQWDENEAQNVIAIRNSPKAPPQRVTFSQRQINSSQALWLIAVGEGKRELVGEIAQGNKALPVCHVRGLSQTLVFVDDASAPGK